jgi:hypothetical protein
MVEWCIHPSSSLFRIGIGIRYMESIKYSKLISYLKVKHMQRRTITITDEQDRWLNDHPEINLSGFVQKALDNLKAAERVIK